MPFEWYQQNLMILRMFKKNKEQVLPEIENLVNSNEREKMELACYIIRELRDESITYLYEKVLASDKESIRKNCIDCLLELDTNNSLMLVERAFLHENKDTQKNIIIALGERSRSQQAVDFLMRLKGMKSQAYNKREIAKNTDLIKKRIG